MTQPGQSTESERQLQREHYRQLQNYTEGMLMTSSLSAVSSTLHFRTYLVNANNLVPIRTETSVLMYYEDVCILWFSFVLYCINMHMIYEL